MIKTTGGSVEAHQWSAASSSWQKIGEVVDAVGSSRKQLYMGEEYDFVFDVDFSDSDRDDSEDTWRESAEQRAQSREYSLSFARLCELSLRLMRRTAHKWLGAMTRARGKILGFYRALLRGFRAEGVELDLLVVDPYERI